MSAEAQIRGVEFAARHWPRPEREWLRALAEKAPREAVVILAVVGEFEAMPVPNP